MYLLCSCHALFYRRGPGSSIQKIKHFQLMGHSLVGRYTFKEDVPKPYTLVASGRRNMEVYEASRLEVKP